MKYLWRVYLICIALPIFLVITFLTAVLTIVTTAVGGSRFWGYWPPHIWSRMVCALLFVRIKVSGRENIDPKQSYIFVCNHQGAFDIWAIYGYLNHNFKWMMKKSLEKIAFVGYACKRSGHVFVDSGSLQSIRQTITDASEKLKDGMSMVIFPEGTRSKTGVMGSFKRGAFMLAAEFRLPVVPLSIDGAYNVMPRSTYFPKPGTIRLVIHPPIHPGEKGFNTRELSTQCRQAIASALPEELRGDE